MRKKDSEWSQAVRKREHNYCQIGLKGCMTVTTQAHHIFVRKYKELRHDIDNGVSVCSNCHGWIEQNPEKGRELCKNRIGDKQWNRLEKKMIKFYKHI